MRGFKTPGGLTVVKSSLLPEKTMYVSADVFERLLQIEEESDAQAERNHQHMMRTAANITDLIKRKTADSEFSAASNGEVIPCQPKTL